MEDFRRQFGMMRRWLPGIAILVLLLGGLTWSVTSSQTEIFEAKGELIVRPGINPDVGDLVVAEQLASQFANASRTRDVSSAIILELGLDESVLEFSQRRTVSAAPGSNVIEITARSEDPEEAVAIAEALASALITNSTLVTQLDPASTVDSYLEVIRLDIARTQEAVTPLLERGDLTDEQEAQLAENGARLVTLQRNYADLLPFSSSLSRNQVSVLEAPELPDDPVEPRPLFWTMLAMTAALLLGTGVAFTLEFLNGRLHDKRDLELATRLPVLGEIVEHRPDIRTGNERRLVVRALPRSTAAEAFRTVRSSIEASAGDVSSLLVTGTMPDDGKTAIAANLAVAYAECGMSVILIDGDLRQPKVHTYFGLDNGRGLTALIGTGAASMASHAQFVRPGLAVLPAGPSVANPAEALASPGFKALMDCAAAEANLVIVVGPSMPTYSDALTIGALVQATLLVASVGTRFNLVRDTAQTLSEARRINLAGAVLRRYTRRGHPRRDRVKHEAATISAGGKQQPLNAAATSPVPPAHQPPGPYAIGRSTERADPK